RGRRGDSRLRPSPRRPPRARRRREGPIRAPFSPRRRRRSREKTAWVARDSIRGQTPILTRLSRRESPESKIGVCPLFNGYSSSSKHALGSPAPLGLGL